MLRPVKNSNHACRFAFSLKRTQELTLAQHSFRYVLSIYNLIVVFRSLKAEASSRIPGVLGLVISIASRGLGLMPFMAGCQDIQGPKKAISCSSSKVEVSQD